MSAPEKILLEMDDDGDIEGFYTDSFPGYKSENGLFYVREDLTGWRSMDTAPKDGTLIDVWHGMWNERFKDVHYDEDEKSWVDDSGKFSIESSNLFTHFMLIPEPPRADS